MELTMEHATKVKPFEKGMIAKMDVEKMTINVKVQDIRVRFGHVDVLVTPVNGAGEQWVENHRIQIIKG
ncbi:MAG: hypothetical protein EBU84_02010 [Actinobacteria bacterium]|jgi:hypothetical protein|nr:hypothetical protein [Actinomycetota bacterium]